MQSIEAFHTSQGSKAKGALSVSSNEQYTFNMSFGMLLGLGKYDLSIPTSRNNKGPALHAW